MAAPWKKHVGATPFDPDSVEGDPPTSGADHAPLDDLVEVQASCPVITAHGDAPDTKAKLNTMNAVMEIMVAVTRRPGMLATNDQRDAAVAGLLRMIREEAEAFAPVISASSRVRPWITGQATRFMAHLVAKQWVQNGNHDVAEPVAMLRGIFASPEFNQFANTVGELDYLVATGKDDAVERMNLSLSKVTASIYYEARRFSFYREQSEVVSHLLKRLTDVIQTEPAYLDISADLRISRIQSRLGRLGDLVAAEYAETIDKAMEHLIETAKKAPKEFAPLKAKYAEEWLRHVDMSFERALKGYQNADALTEQVLLRFQNDVRPSSSPAP